MDNKILIVCIGNICRSPIAEGLFVDKFRENGKGAQISSAGLGALVDFPADATSQELMLNKGFDISKHRAKQLTAEIVFDSDIIITMTADQTKEVEKSFPGAKGRVYRIGHWGGFDVVDPYKRPKIIFEQAFALIEQGVNEWYARF